MFFEIIELCNSVKELYDTQKDGKYIFRPRITALDTFKTVVIRAYTYIGKAPVIGAVTTDTKEGLIVSWIMPSGEYIKCYIFADGTSKLSYLVNHNAAEILNPTYLILVHYLQNLS